jgi:hypothetical protein
MVTIGMGEDGSELFGCCKVHRIVQARIRTYAALEPVSPPIDLAKQLDLQPTIIPLNDIRRG